MSGFRYRRIPETTVFFIDPLAGFGANPRLFKGNQGGGSDELIDAFLPLKQGQLPAKSQKTPRTLEDNQAWSSSGVAQTICCLLINNV